MAAIALSPLAPATLSALSALRPVQPLPITEDKTSGSSALTLQDLAQGLFQRTLQASVLAPLAEPGGGNLGVAPEATASLLASLTAPQAPASATPAADATAPAGAQATLPSGATAATASTAPSPSPPAAVLPEVPATQDAFASSSSLEFALQAALRFGAGVAGQGTPALPSADLSTGLIRDAAAVPRLEGLQAQTGAPGPEAFLRPSASNLRLLRTYEISPAPVSSPQATGVDLFA
ncbi:MAG: hypothetical protein U0P46_07485 [Holophagaceae bacterium]